MSYVEDLNKNRDTEIGGNIETNREVSEWLQQEFSVTLETLVAWSDLFKSTGVATQHRDAGEAIHQQISDEIGNLEKDWDQIRSIVANIYQRLLQVNFPKQYWVPEVGEFISKVFMILSHEALYAENSKNLFILDTFDSFSNDILDKVILENYQSSYIEALIEEFSLEESEKDIYREEIRANLIKSLEKCFRIPGWRGSLPMDQPDLEELYNQEHRLIEELLSR